jgi:predicted ATP-binding protein involved in virulence
LTIELHNQLTLLVGVNGAGKSTILDGMSILLSWAAARLRSAKASGRKITNNDIKNQETFSWISITCDSSIFSRGQLSWLLSQTRKGKNPRSDDDGILYKVTNFGSLNNWASDMRNQISQNESNVGLPLFVYYPVNRSVLDIPLRIRKSHDFSLLEAYDGALTMGANFRSFFEWYRNREDLENERFRDSQQNLDGKNSPPFTEDIQLNAVRRAINSFLPDFSHISVKRNPLRMEVTKRRRAYRIDQLSDGEKCLFAMVGDLARRLAIANPERSDVLNGEGIVLIDEIDLHLHPAWQRMVVSKLKETFPNCQFVISTHSPQVFGEVEAGCIRRLTIDEDYGLTVETPQQALGLDSSEILEEEMDAKSRNQEIDNWLSSIFDLIDDELFEEAKNGIEELRQKLGGSIPEIVRAESLITMLEPEEGEHQ